VLVHLRYDPRIPGGHERAVQRARRLQSAVETHHAPLVAAGDLFVRAVVRAGESAHLDPVEPIAATHACGCRHTESHA
jgi:hypothetical protein